MDAMKRLEQAGFRFGLGDNQMAIGRTGPERV
jgi:hypothetical protein